MMKRDSALVSSTASASSTLALLRLTYLTRPAETQRRHSPREQRNYKTLFPLIISSVFFYFIALSFLAPWS